MGEVGIFYATVHVLLAIFFGMHKNKDMPVIFPQYARNFCWLITRHLEEVFIPSFSAIGIADIFRHQSFNMLNKQDTSKSTNHSPLACPFQLVVHLHKSDMKQTKPCISCDWLISNSTSKEECQLDVER